MAIWQRHNIKQPITDRAPGEKGSLPWIQKEGWAFFQQVRRVVNWIVKYLGKVGVDQTDVPGVAEAKLIAGAGISITKQGAPGARTLVFSAAGGGVEPPAPEVASTTLYTAKVADPLDMGDVYCVFIGAHSIGTNNPMMEGAFTEVAPGTFQANVAGLLPSAWFDGQNPDPFANGGVSRLLGKRIVAFYPDPPSVSGWDEVRQYVFIVDDVGRVVTDMGLPTQTITDTYARFRADPAFATSAAWKTGMKFFVDGGAAYGGGTLTFNNTGTFTLGTTAMNWSWAAGVPTVTEKFELLTGPQLTSEGASTEIIEQWVAASSVGTPFDKVFTTLPGTPGVTSIAAGPYRFDIDATKIDGGDIGSVTLIRARLLRVSNGSPVVEADSAPLSNTAYAPLSWTYIKGSATTVPPDERLDLQYQAVTNSTTPVVVFMRYSSPSHGTEVTLPFEMAVSGGVDGVHDHLSGRDTVNNHYGACALTASAGVIPVPTKRAAVVTVSGTTTLIGMATAGLQTGVQIELVFLQACKILSGATVGAGQAPFILGTMDGVQFDIDWTLPSAQTGGRIGVTYYATELPKSPCFLLTWGPTI